MRLEKLVLNGFKSFAEKTTFEFPKQFTAVVGPNGSGKSNVSDAIRWVLGEQSMKLLRGKHTTDLIFGGSDTLNRVGMAQVELHLDNNDGLFPVDFKEVVIARKLFRSGDSEYTLNGAKVRLADITMMLAQANFGQKSYAVIGQGMITGFLNATPQERKMFFDEATGVREFQIKRDQAINKLIRTEENLVQSDALLGEIEPHLKSLIRQVKRLEKREKVEEELRDVQISFFGSLWQELKEEKQRIQTELTEKEKEMIALDKKLQEKQSATDVLAQEASRGERYQQLQQQFNDLLEKKSHLMKEQAVLKGKLEVEHERQGELSLVWLQRKEDEIKNELRDKEDTRSHITQQSERERAELKRKEKQLAVVGDDFRQEEHHILKLREQIETNTHAMTVPEIQTEMTELFAQQETFLRELLATTSMDEFRGLQKKGQKLTEKFAEFMDRLTEDARGTVEALRIEMKHKEQTLEKLVAERDDLQRQVNALQVSIETNRHKDEMLESEVKRMAVDLSELQSNIDATNKERTATDKDKEAERYANDLLHFESQLGDLDKQQVTVRSEMDSFNSEEEEKKTQLVEIQSEMRATQRTLTAAQQDSSTLEVSLARVETRQEDVEHEIVRDVPEELHKKIYGYSSEEVVSRSQLETRMSSLQRQIEAIGSVDAETVKEHDETKERFDFLTEQTGDLSKSIMQLEKIIDELDATIKKQFEGNFKKINTTFQEYFKVLFGGGSSKLELLTNEDDEAAAKAQASQVGADGDESSEELSGESLHDEKERELIGKKKKKQKVVSGIEVLASPPGKKITNINSLSGGEKSMVAIALLCSIIDTNPSPFVVLDEVEAALDEENSEKLAAIIKQLSNKTQIIIITHNRVTMRAADILYGVTMGKEGKSHILSVELEEANELVDEAPVKKKKK